MRNKILSLKLTEEGYKYPERILGVPTYERVPMADIKGQIVAAREIVNVKVEKGKVLDDARLRLTAKDLAWILDNGGTPVFWGHNGRKSKGDLVDFDTADGKVIIDALADILKSEYGYELNYCNGVITSKGIDAGKAVFVKGKANLLNNIRVYENSKDDNFTSAVFAEEFKAIFKDTGVQTFFCGAFGDIGSKGPSSHKEFLGIFKNVAWGSAIVDEMLDMEKITRQKVIQFAGNKLDKTEVLLNLKKALQKGGTIYLGSAVSAMLTTTGKGEELLEELRRHFNIITPGQTPASNMYNLAIPTIVYAENLIVKGKDIGEGYPDITLGSAQWIIDSVISTLAEGDEVLFNGIVSFREAGYLDTTRMIIEAIAEKIKSGSKINMIGGDGPANFKEFSTPVLGSLDAYTDNGQIVGFSGGGVPLKYVTEGLKKLVIAEAMHLVNN